MYLACFLAVWHILDYPKAKGNAVAQTMSRFVPGIHYFGDFVDKHDHFDEFKLHQCIAYHKRVINFFPFQKSEAYQMLGFCYDRLGNTAMAIQSYQASIKANPEYFWPYYNLGIYAYRKGNYSKAVNYFQQALQKDLKINMLLMLRSKVFTDVRLSDRPDYNVFEGIKDGREVAYIFMMESLFKIGAYDQLLGTALAGLKEGFGDQDIFLYYAGKAAFCQKSYEKAVELLQLALQKNPHNPDALLYMGLCMRVAGKEDLAKNFSVMARQELRQQGSAIEKYLNTGIRFF